MMAREQYACSEGVASANGSLDLAGRQIHRALHQNIFVIHNRDYTFRKVKDDRATNAQLADCPREILSLA